MAGIHIQVLALIPSNYMSGILTTEPTLAGKQSHLSQAHKLIWEATEQFVPAIQQPLMPGLAAVVPTNGKISARG
jgi:hypothetical protein